MVSPDYTLDEMVSLLEIPAHDLAWLVRVAKYSKWDRPETDRRAENLLFMMGSVSKQVGELILNPHELHGINTVSCQAPRLREMLASRLIYLANIAMAEDYDLRGMPTRSFNFDDRILCPKCSMESGDSWEQCCGKCPMEGTPHYNPNALEPISVMTGKSQEILKKSLLRTYWVLCHPSVAGASVVAAIHGAVYDGPVWIQQPEIQAALKLAGLPSELPDPKYPDDEAGVFKRKYREVTSGTQTFTEHVWEEPSPEEALFLGTFHECGEWSNDSGSKKSTVMGLELEGDHESIEYYITRTGRTIDKGEEAAFFALFDD